MVRDLATTLAARGHQVTLYAASDSDPSALPGVRLITIATDTTQLDPADFTGQREQSRASESAMRAAFERGFEMIAGHSREYDLIHAHAYDLPALLGGARQALPNLHTLHMPSLGDDFDAALASLAPPGAPRSPRQPWLATVSTGCAETYRDVCRIDAVINNGVAVEAIPFGAQPASPPFLLFAGRISPEKGAADAISIARAANMSLLMVGGVYDQRYFSRQIEPLLQSEPSQVTYLGSLEHERVWELMAGATALLVPSHWEEPFGLAACEAQAAGAPVIAYARGGLRDIIVDRETGALVTPGDITAAAESVGWVSALNRRACRQRVERRFTLSQMATGYEALYARMLVSS